MILRNTAWNYLSTVVSLAVGLAVVPLLIRFLGEVHYGMWVLVGAVAGYAGILDLGFSVSISKWLAEHRGDDSDGERNAFLSTVFTVLLGFGALVLLATAGMAVALDHLFSIDPADITTARLLLLVVGLAAATEFPLGLFGHVIYAYERLDVANGLTIVQLLIALGLIVTVLVAGYGVLAVGVVNTGVTLLVQASRFWLARRMVPSLRLSCALFDPLYLRQILRFSLYMGMNQLSKRLTLRTDEIVVGLFLPLSAVSVYSVGLRLSNAARALSEQLARVVFPTGAALYACNDLGRLRRLVLEGTRLTVAFGLPVATAVLVLADDIVHVWIGREVESAATVSRLLVLATVSAMVQWVPTTVALAAGRAAVPSTLSALEALANVTLSVTLVSSFGLPGVAAGTLVPALVVGACVQVPYACRVLHIPLARFASEALAPAVLPAIPVAAVLIIWSRYVPDASLVGVSARLMLALSLYWLLFLSFGISAADARKYRAHVRLLLTRPLSSAGR